MFFLRSLLVLLIGFTCASCAGISRQMHPFFEGVINLNSASPRQIVEVTPDGKNIFQARLTAWTYNQGVWQKGFGPWPAVIGRSGFAPLNEKREGDGKTPSGVYVLLTAFGKETKLNTGLSYRQVKEDDIWVDDVASAQYNLWVKAPTSAASYEKMLQFDGLYDLGAVIEYNTHPIVPGRGSAIFIHIWRDRGTKPTAGCVALDPKRLRQLLAWLRANREPVIVLGSTPVQK